MVRQDHEPRRRLSTNQGIRDVSAVLRASGDGFDVDTFLVGCTLPVCAVWRRGESLFPASQPDGRRHERSGVNVSVSDADFSEFPRQAADATDFLRDEFE